MRIEKYKARGVAASRLADWRRVDDSRSELYGAGFTGALLGASGDVGGRRGCLRGWYAARILAGV